VASGDLSRIVEDAKSRYGDVTTWVTNKARNGIARITGLHSRRGHQREQVQRPPRNLQEMLDKVHIILPLLMSDKPKKKKKPRRGLQKGQEIPIPAGEFLGTSTKVAKTNDQVTTGPAMDSPDYSCPHCDGL